MFSPSLDIKILKELIATKSFKVIPPFRKKKFSPNHSCRKKNKKQNQKKATRTNQSKL